MAVLGLYLPSPGINTLHSGWIRIWMCCICPTEELRSYILGKLIICRFGKFEFPCTKTVKLLWNEGFSVNTINNNGDTPLCMTACSFPTSSPEIEHALYGEVNVQSRSDDKCYLLTNMLEVLLDEGVHHDFVNLSGQNSPGRSLNWWGPQDSFRERNTAGVEMYRGQGCKKVSSTSSCGGNHW